VGKRSVTIYDIAKLAGVSAATVSNVLNGKGRVSERTRKLVQDIADEQGYVTNSSAKSLREARTRTVGVVTPDVSNDFFSSIVQGIETLLSAKGYMTFICDTANDLEREAGCVHNLVEKQVDGIVFVGGDSPRWSKDVPETIPCAYVDRQLPEPLDGATIVDSDARQITYECTCLLKERGCERIAYLCVAAGGTAYIKDVRYKGFCDALRDCGIRLDKNLVLAGPHEQSSLVESRELVGRCLDDGFDFDGIVAIGDRLALGALGVLKEHGVAVGKDVLLIGQDNSLYSRITTPAISTVERHTDQMARAAVESLLEMVEGDSHGGNVVEVPHEIVERATTLGRA
jgi:LacI family transcriptional regulator